MPRRISIIIPTQRRAEGLERAIRSVLAQTSEALSTSELVVVDNDERDSARALVGRLAAGSALPILYVHQARPGVASARNAAVQAAGGALLAFLDDDEEASPQWLGELLRVHAAQSADVVFGPIQGRAPAGSSHRRYLEAFFSRTGPAKDALISRWYGCGNSLVARAALPQTDPPFLEAYDQRGGEDDHLFAEMMKQGRRFAWAANAWVFEDPAPARLTLGYTLARAFAYGQGATVMRAKYAGPASVVWSMATGAAQTVVFGAAAIIAEGLRRRERAWLWDRAARGLGKLLWIEALHAHFYGQRRPEPATPASRAEPPPEAGALKP